MIYRQVDVLVDNGWLADWTERWMSGWVGDGQVIEICIRNNLGELRGSWTGVWHTGVSFPLWESVQHPPGRGTEGKSGQGAQECNLSP